MSLATKRGISCLWKYRIRNEKEHPARLEIFIAETRSTFTFLIQYFLFYISSRLFLFILQNKRIDR